MRLNSNSNSAILENVHRIFTIVILWVPLRTRTECVDNHVLSFISQSIIIINMRCPSMGYIAHQCSVMPTCFRMDGINAVTGVLCLETLLPTVYSVPPHVISLRFQRYSMIFHIFALSSPISVHNVDTMLITQWVFRENDYQYCHIVLMIVHNMSHVTKVSQFE